MYCINCGVKLADTEQKCPLCNTAVYHPEFVRPDVRPQYPGDKMPQPGSGKKALGGITILLFLIPLMLSFFSDLQMDGRLNWFGYVAGALAVGYIIFALPMWFRKPNPVCFVPCDFAAVALYLFYLDWATKGDWFWSFALPALAGLALIVCTVVTLLSYVRRGKLYIGGGTVIAVGAWLLLIEALIVRTFRLVFIGWSVYPLIVLSLMGGTLIYAASSSSAREMIERKLFF